MSINGSEPDTVQRQSYMRQGTLRKVRGVPHTKPIIDVAFGPRMPNVLVLAPDGSRLAFRCEACGGEPARSDHAGQHKIDACDRCDDVGFIGIDPTHPILSPDSEARAACYRARYVAGMPLWNAADTNGMEFRQKEIADGACDLL